MVLLAHSSSSQNFIKSTNKSPEYARDYKKEYLFIIGLDKEFKYLVDNINDATRGLFESHKVDRIKYFIKRFLRGQERGKLKDVSNLEINNDDVGNIIEIKKNFDNFNQYIKYCYECAEDDDDECFIDRYPGYKNIKDDFELFFSKLNIKYEDSDSDSDSDIEDVNVVLPDSDIEDLNISFTDSDIEDFNNILNNLVSGSVSDSDSDSDILF